MSDQGRLKPMSRLMQPSANNPYSMSAPSSWIIEFKQQIKASLEKHEVEEKKVDKVYNPPPLKDSLTLFQKIANAEYLQKISAMKAGTGATSAGDSVKGKRLAKKDSKQHETVKVDKEKIKRRKLEADPDTTKTKQYLVTKELNELEILSNELDKTADPESVLTHFKYILKRNCELVSLMPCDKSGAAALRPMDMMLLNMILNKFKAHMYILISHWLYQEYNLYLSRNTQTCLLNYEDIVNEFCNKLEHKASDELVKSVEDWYNFIWTLPYLTKRVYQNIYTMCIKEDPKGALEPFSTVPLRLLKDLIMSPAHKEAVNHKALKELLRLSIDVKDSVKLKAIKMLSPELYAISKYKEMIKEFAFESFAKLKEFKGTEDDNAIKSLIGLLLRISADEPKALLGAMKNFSVLKDKMKIVILGQCKKMFEKCWPLNKEGIKEVFEETPAEGVQIVQVYVEVYKNTSFPGPLKQALITLAKKISNYELLQPLIPQISQIEIDKNELIEFAAKAKYPGKRDFIYGLVQNMSKSTDYWEKFRKILIRLHTCEVPPSISKEVVTNILSNIVETVDLCIDKKELFQLNDVVLPALNELAKRDKVPILLPRTLIKVTTSHPMAITECLKIIKVLLERKNLDENTLYGLKQYLLKYPAIVEEHLSMFSAESAKWIHEAIENK